MAEVLILIYRFIKFTRFTKLLKFSKPGKLITFLLLTFSFSLQAQIPDSCLAQWDDFPYQNDSNISANFPDFITCCGTIDDTQKDSLLGRAFHLKAIIQWQENDFIGTVLTNRKALQIRKKTVPPIPSDIGHSHLNIGIIFSHHLHRFQQAKKHLDTAWQYLAQGENHELRGDCKLEKAILMRKFGDVEQSFLLIDQAIQNYEPLANSNQPFLIANATLVKGELYAELGEFEQASQAYQEALLIYVEAGDLFEKANVLHDLGHLEMEQQHWEQGFSFFQQGNNVYRQLTSAYQDIPEALAYIQEQNIKSTIGLGSCLIQLGNYVRAEKELLSAWKGTLSNQIDLKASIADNLGDLYRFWENKDSRSFDFFNEGLKLLFPDFSPKSPFDCPMLEEKSQIIGETDLILTLVQDKAKALKKVGYSLDSTEKTKYLESALQHYLLADQLSFRFRQDQQAEASRLFWQQENRAMYEAAIDLCYELGKPEQAFQLMENSKALVLLETLKDAIAKASAGISEADLQAEQQLKGDIAQLAARIAGLSKGEEKTTYQKRLNELSLQQSELKETFKNRYPQYFIYKYGQWTKEASDIQKALGESGLIEYFEGKTSLYLCYLSKDTLIFSKTEKKEKVIETFMQAIKNPLLNRAMAQAGYQLYEQLFQPLFSSSLSEKLFIIPDGRITQIPFDALCSAPALVDGRPAYLLHQHQISYAYSASVLFQKTVEGTVSSKKLLAIAPGSFEKLKLPTLPHSEPEAQSIIKTVGGKALLGDAATKSAFLTQSKNYKLLHLSTHAAADSIGSPWIAFKDSFLYLPAIYGLETQAELVVLSACQTSQGKLAIGEGVMSLARAFRYAGVPSVLASMWEAEDASAKFIMEVFYKKLKAGLPKDEALSEAKRAYLAEDAHFSFRSPFFWSNFVLVGDVGELEKSGKLGKNEIRLFIGLLFTLILYFYFRTQNRRKHAPPK